VEVLEVDGEAVGVPGERDDAAGDGSVGGLHAELGAEDEGEGDGALALEVEVEGCAWSLSAVLDHQGFWSQLTRVGPVPR